MSNMIPLIQKKADQVMVEESAENKNNSIEMDFKKMIMVEGLQELVLSDPTTSIKVGEAAIRSSLEPDQNVHLNLRIFNLNDAYERRIRDLTVSDAYRLISVEVDIKKIRENKPRSVLSVWECGTCHFKQEIIQDQFYERQPISCQKEDGGCGKNLGSTRFHKVKEKEVMIDQQKLLVTEKRESLYGNQQPRDIIAYIEDDLVGKLEGGETVKLTGVPKLKEVREHNLITTTNTIYLDVNHIDMSNVKGYKVVYTQEEIDAIIAKLGDDPLESLSESFCTFIKGMHRIKQVLILQQVRGSTKPVSGDKKRRRDIHVLLLGDPGTGKSDLAEEACSLIPGSIKIDGSGNNTTPAGLTAIAVRDDFGDGKFTLDNGAAVLAHGKNLYIDECHLMRIECFGALRRPMESQTVDIAKGGLQRELKSQFSGIFVANPKDGKFKHPREDVPVIEQMDLKRFDAPWRDRIDYFGVVYNLSDVERDKNICRHIMADEHGHVKPEITKDEIIKYLAYCRDNFNPKIPESSIEEVSEKYAFYKSGPGNKGTSYDFYTRDLFSAFRFAEAHAKLNRREVCTEQDIQLGFDLVYESLVALTAGIDGVPDPDAYVTGIGKKKRIMTAEVIDLMRNLNYIDGITNKELTDICKEKGIKNIDQIMKNLRDQRVTYKDDNNKWHLMP